MTNTDEISFSTSHLSASLRMQKSIDQFQHAVENVSQAKPENIETSLLNLEQAKIQVSAEFKSEMIIEKTKGSILDIIG